MGAGALEAQGRQRVHGGIDDCNAPFERVEQVVRRHLTALKSVDKRTGVGLDQFIGAHSGSDSID